MQDLTSIYNVSKEIADIYRKKVNDEYPGGKLSMFTWNVEFDGNIYELKFYLPPEWKWVEYGRRPAPVSREGQNNLKEWIKKHWDDVPDNPKALDAAVFVLSRKLKRVGYFTPKGATNVPMAGPARGKHFLEKSLEEADPQIQKICAEITRLIQKDASTEIKTIFTGLDFFKPVN